ncbi:MAG TPA: hypothetical protein VIH62_01845, partial [Xanthobacteraceae bacterium]
FEKALDNVRGRLGLGGKREGDGRHGESLSDDRVRTILCRNPAIQKQRQDVTVVEVIAGA